jgi:hypothetical protein
MGLMGKLSINAKYFSFIWDTKGKDISQKIVFFKKQKKY